MHTQQKAGEGMMNRCVCVYKCANTLTQEKGVKGKKEQKPYFLYKNINRKSLVWVGVCVCVAREDEV